MQSSNLQKPEYVLKRANDLINSAIGNADKEKRWALELIHNFIGAKRKISQWNKVFETLMKRHVELCVDLKNHHFAKDGLHQYRNLCQTMDPNSLEVVIHHLIDLAEARATAARLRADKVALAAAAKISDLDQEESPESIMLSSMTEDGAKERTDREVVVPWLKFLWETYRAVLELLHKIPKLERVYHKTCEKAFKFCLDYERNLEFRRLCDMLRMHLSNLQKMAGQPARPNKPSWDWTPEAIELHLQTRFSQLELATSLELWNEGFRTVGDIYDIMAVGRKTHKPKLMSIYYEKLTRIFWVSGNHLFHAYAWSKYYHLSCECRKDMKAEEKSLLASSVLLSALSIPSLKDFDPTVTVVDDDETATEKHQQIATLLDFQSNPTRKALLADIVAECVLSDVLPELRGLYDCLESKFHPLTLVKELMPAITAIKSRPQLAIYALPLQRVAVLRVMQQLSKVYSVIKLDFVRSIVAGLSDIGTNAVEKIMIDGVSRKQLQLRIDHKQGCVRFSGTAVSSVMETHIAQVGVSLSAARVKTLKTVRTEKDAEKEMASRLEYFAIVADAAAYEQQNAQQRKELIEQRKVELERAQEERIKAQQLVQEQIFHQQQADEQARLEMEARRREEEKQKKIREKEDIRRVQKELERYGVYKDETQLAALDSASRMGLVSDAKSEALKAKEDEGRRVSDQAKRLDHITRALRIEAAEIVVKKTETQTQNDHLKHEAKLAEFAAESKAVHAASLLEKQRVAKFQPLRTEFEESLLAAQRAAYNTKVEAMRKRALNEHRQRKIATARRLLDEELERLREEEELEKERKDREERARQEKEQYEVMRKKQEEKEAQEKARELEEERERQERLAKLEQERQKAIEEKKLRLQQQAAPAGAGVGADAATIPRGVPLPPAKEKEEQPSTWRAGAPAKVPEPATPAASRSKLDEWSRSALSDAPKTNKLDEWSRSGPPKVEPRRSNFPETKRSFGAGPDSGGGPDGNRRWGAMGSGAGSGGGSFADRGGDRDGGRGGGGSRPSGLADRSDRDRSVGGFGSGGGGNRNAPPSRQTGVEGEKPKPSTEAGDGEGGTWKRAGPNETRPVESGPSVNSRQDNSMQDNSWRNVTSKQPLL